LVLAALRAPESKAKARGAGRWLPLSEGDAFEQRLQKGAAVWLDGSGRRGCFVYALVLAGLAAYASRLLKSSAYDALLVLLASSALLPLFFTGKASDVLPEVDVPADVLRRLRNSLRRRTGAKVTISGRVTHDSGGIDEVRLLVQLKNKPEGLSAVEVGVERWRGTGGVLHAPYVLVRVKEGSPAQKALGREVSWVRGRKSDERVALVRPILPSVSLCVKSVEFLAKLLERGAPTDRGQPNNARSSSGRAERATKPLSVRSPAHAM
jgi:hypothetical protein